MSDEVELSGAEARNFGARREPQELQLPRIMLRESRKLSKSSLRGFEIVKIVVVGPKLSKLSKVLVRIR